MGRTPQAMNRFPEVDIRVLQRVADAGRLDIKFETHNMAYNTKFRLLRLIKSLEFHEPNNPLTPVAVLMTIKINTKTNTITILRKDQSSEANSMEEALAGGTTLAQSADTEEAGKAGEDETNQAMIDAGMWRREPDGRITVLPESEWPAV